MQSLLRISARFSGGVIILQLLNNPLINVSLGNVLADAELWSQMCFERLEMHHCSLRTASMMRREPGYPNYMHMCVLIFTCIEAWYAIYANITHACIYISN